MAWEGLTIIQSRVLYAGDELRPGTGVLDTDSGAIFKFVPETIYDDGAVLPEDSPIITGKTFAMQVSCREVGDKDFPQYGQGCEIGVAWGGCLGEGGCFFCSFLC